MYRKGKDIRKKRHQIFKLPNLCGNPIYQQAAAFVFVPFVFGQKFPTAKFFMRTLLAALSSSMVTVMKIFIYKLEQKCVFSLKDLPFIFTFSKS
jgi:hypothetical protein